MNKELALRTFAYLIRHYKTHNATIINKQEIEAIEFILNDNEFLEQQLHDASIQIQELIEKDIWCPSNCEKLEKIKEEVKALNKGLRKVQQRSIKYKNRCLKLNKKIKELKEQLEDMTLCRDIASGHRKEVQDRETILLNQQKEFIKYLENMLDNENDIFSVVRVKDALQKYKEIIGVER